MKVEIKVTTDRELNQAQSQRLRRVANVLREAGFDVDITHAPQMLIKKSA